MNHAVRLLISFLFSLSAYATCPDAPTSVLECRGAKLVTNQSELDAYLQNFAENTTKGFIRGVRLRGNFSGTSQNIATPCKIIIDEASTLNFSEELCLISKDKVIARRGLNLFGKDVTLKAPNRIIIQDNATIDLNGDLTLHSHGPTEESRAHIRHSANVKVNNLTLRGLYRSTLGKESTYEAQGKISVFSTGEERPTDEDISEWSTVWRDTTIQADEFEARALWRVKVGTRTAINASKITLDGQGCKIGRDATLTALEKQGRCLLPNRPVARFKISPKEASIGESILLDGSRSQNAAAGESFRWRIDMPNGERIDTRKVEGPTYEFTPTQAGEHTIELRVYDQDGFHDWKKRKLIVRGSELFSYYKFELEEEKLSLIYEGRTLSDDRSIVEAFYTAPDGSRIDVGRRVLGHVDVIDSFDATEPVDLKLTIVDDLGTREEFTHTIEPRAEFQRPVLNFETIEYAPNKLVFFSNFMFDPYNQLSDFDGFTLDFGDESSVEINAESFSTTHLYSSEGQYPAKIYAGDYENQKEITVTGSPSSFEFPLADFKVDGASWAPGVRLYVDQTISPASPIQSYLWRLGDGTTAYGPEVLHFYNEGAYDVSLTVVLDNGTSSTVTREVIIMQTAPNLVGTVDCYDIGDKKAECHVEALDKLSDLKTLNINFGDSPQSIESTTVSGQWAEHTFIHSYEETGNYTVTMQALTNRGEEFFTTTEVAVGENPSNLPPVAFLNCYSLRSMMVACDPGPSFDQDGYIVSYNYNFGDGQIQSSQDPSLITFNYTTAGEKTVELEVVDNEGSSSFAFSTILVEEVVNSSPVADFMCTQGSNFWVTCDASSSYDQDGYIVNYEFSSEFSNPFNGSFYSFQVDSYGDFDVSLTVTDNVGEDSLVTKSFTYVADEFQFPIAVLVCESLNNLTISCDASDSYDPYGESITFEYKVNGSTISESSNAFSFVFSEERENEIELIVTNQKGLSRKVVVTVDSVIDSTDALLASLSCERVGQLLVDCSVAESEGVGLEFEWSVDGIVLSNEMRKSLIMEFDSFGFHTIEVSLRNEIFTKNRKFNIELNPILPNAEFSYAYDRDGNLLLNADRSLSEGRDVDIYEWSVVAKGITERTTIPIFALDSDSYDGLEVKLKVIDSLGNEDETAQIIVGNGNLSSSDFFISSVQQQGKASKKFSFEILNRSDFVDEELVISWSIEGIQYNNLSVNHIFQKRGEHIIQANISFGDRSIQVEDVVFIEEFNIIDLGGVYSPTTMFMFEIENYIPENEVTLNLPNGIIINLLSIEKDNFKDSLYGMIVPVLELENGDVNVSLSIDGEVYPMTISFSGSTYSSDPEADVATHLNYYLNQAVLELVGTEYEGDETVIATISEAYNEIKNFVEDDQTSAFTKQLVEMTLRTNKEIFKASAPFAVSETQKKSSQLKLLDLFLPNAHASMIDLVQINNRCLKFLDEAEGNTGKTAFARLTSLITMNFPVVYEQFKKIKGVNSPNVYITVVSTVLSLIADANASIYIIKAKDAIEYCRDRARFPIDSIKQGVNLDIQVSGAEVTENGATEVHAGATYTSKINYPFGNIFNEDIRKDNPIF
ncbi:MAG: PKD domain-containing protein [Bdellovibrionota bacterium]|nr:PKD domain-containing protein [Bdellovibrionota bacterium]